MFNQEQLSTLRRHAVEVERQRSAYAEAIKREWARLAGPYSDRIRQHLDNQYPTDLIDEATIDPEEHPVIRRLRYSSETHKIIRRLDDEVMRACEGLRPTIRPDDTPAELAEWIRLRLILLIERDEVPERTARGLYRKAWDRASRFTMIVPENQAILQERSDPIIGLTEIKNLFEHAAESKEISKGSGTSDSGAVPSERVGISDELSISARNAYHSYIEIKEIITLRSDREIYNYIKEHGCEIYEGRTLPSFETWDRYLRQARRSLGEQKNKPRAGRCGRSMVRTDETG